MVSPHKLSGIHHVKGGLPALLVTLLLATAAFAQTLHTTDSDSLHSNILAPEIQDIISRHVLKLKEVLQNTQTISAIRTANAQHQAMTKEEIKELDDRWIADKGFEFFQGRFVDKGCSGVLRSFRNQFPEFAEIFVTDIHGLNVCLTNKTSDFYQADESWWQTGLTQVSLGHIEYDESAETHAIIAVVQVFDQDTGKVIGLAKAVLDFDSIVREL